MLPGFRSNSSTGSLHYIFAARDIPQAQRSIYQYRSDDVGCDEVAWSAYQNRVPAHYMHTVKVQACES